MKNDPEKLSHRHQIAMSQELVKFIFEVISYVMVM